MARGRFDCGLGCLRLGRVRSLRVDGYQCCNNYTYTCSDLVHIDSPLCPCMCATQRARGQGQLLVPERFPHGGAGYPRHTVSGRYGRDIVCHLFFRGVRGDYSLCLQS